MPPALRSILSATSLIGVLLAGCGEAPSTPLASEAPGQVEQGLLTLVTCPIGSTVNQYSPPLTNTPRDTTITGTSTFSLCTGLFSDVTSGTLPIDVFRPGYSCNDLLEVGSTRAVVTWNTGETSTLLQTRATVQVGATTIVITYVGTVESGRFAGATAIRTLTYLTTDLTACGSPEGVPGMSGLTTLTLLGLP